MRLDWTEDEIARATGTSLTPLDADGQPLTPGDLRWLPGKPPELVQVLATQRGGQVLLSGNHGWREPEGIFSRYMSAIEATGE